MSDRGKLRVLIVDDMQAMRAIAKTHVTSLGAEVAGEAENGEVALELYLAEKPDLVLLDIEMPVKDGISTLKAILAEDSNANIVMLTSVDNMMVVEDCIFAGARDYIRKDVNPEEMKLRLQKELAKLK